MCPQQFLQISSGQRTKAPSQSRHQFGGLHQRGDPTELRAVLRIGNAREVDLEELPVVLAVARRVQHTVDVMEDVFRRQRNFFTIPIDDEKRIC